MILKVHREYGEIVGVSVEQIPADFTDGDVKYTVELHAAKGDQTAKDALTTVGEYWINMGGGTTSRCYFDG